MRSRVKLFYVMVLAFVMIAGGLIILRQLDRDVALLEDVATEVRLAQIRAKNTNDALNREVARRDEPAYIANVAKTEYGYLQNGEIKFKVIKDRKGVV